MGFRAVAEETPGSRGDGVLAEGTQTLDGGVWASVVWKGPLACREPSHRAQKPEWEGVINNRRAPGSRPVGGDDRHFLVDPPRPSVRSRPSRGDGEMPLSP